MTTTLGKGSWREALEGVQRTQPIRAVLSAPNICNADAQVLHAWECYSRTFSTPISMAFQLNCTAPGRCRWQLNRQQGGWEMTSHAYLPTRPDSVSLAGSGRCSARVASKNRSPIWPRFRRSKSVERTKLERWTRPGRLDTLASCLGAVPWSALSPISCQLKRCFMSSKCQK